MGRWWWRMIEEGNVLNMLVAIEWYMVDGVKTWDCYCTCESYIEISATEDE